MSSRREEDFVGKEVDMKALLQDGASSHSSAPVPAPRSKQLNRLRKAGEAKRIVPEDEDDVYHPSSGGSENEDGTGRFRMRDENDTSGPTSASKKRQKANGRASASKNSKIDQFTKSGPKKSTKGIDPETADYLEQQEAKRKAKWKNEDDDWNLADMKLESEHDEEFAEEDDEDSDEQLIRALKESKAMANQQSGTIASESNSKPTGTGSKKAAKNKRKDSDDDDLEGFIAPDDESLSPQRPSKVSGTTNRTSRATRPSRTNNHISDLQREQQEFGDMDTMDPEMIEALFIARENEEKEVVRKGESDKKSSEKKFVPANGKATKKRRDQDTSDDEEFLDDELSGQMIDEKKASKPKTASKTALPKKEAKIRKTRADDDDEGTGLEIKGVLSGQNIVFTGLFQCTGGDNKEPLMEIVKTLGGRCPSSVSGKTSILVAGHILPDGRPTNTSGKYQSALDKKVKIMTEDEFEEYLREKTGQLLVQLIKGGAVQFAQTGAATAIGGKMDEEKQPLAAKAADQSRTNRIEPEEQAFAANALWTDKYAPKSLDDVIGNQGMINKLREWLLNWEDVVINGNKREIKASRAMFNPNAFAAENVNARAAMLSGSPGIGKTTTVRLLCKELGLNLIEQNASDMRNKNSIQGCLGTMTTTSSLNSNAETGKSVILMDEVDGMTSDRGGTAALNEYIKKTKVPIICVCNDRSHPKMRTLAGNCYDLKYSKPSRPQVAQWLLKIIRKEGLDGDMNSLELLVEEMNNDIRQILGFLQVWSKRKTNKTFIYATFAKQVGKFAKDDAVTVGNFEAAQMLLNRQSRQNKTYHQLMGYFFIDYDLVPLLVQENYLNAARRDANDLDSLRRLAKAADSIAKSDKTNLLVRRDQNWKLLDTVGFNSSIYPAHLISEFIPVCQFPSFYGKFSSEKKMQRELIELKEALMGEITGSQDSIKFEYGPTLLNMLKMHLLSATDTSTEAVLDIYNRYNLTPDLVKEHLVDIIFNPAKHDLMQNIDAKVKAHITRQYNSKFKESIVQKKKRRMVLEGEGDGEEEGMILEDRVSNADGQSIMSANEADSDDDDVTIEAVKAPKNAKKGAANKSKKNGK